MSRSDNAGDRLRNALAARAALPADEALITAARVDFHKVLLEYGILGKCEKRVKGKQGKVECATNADANNTLSVKLSLGILSRLSQQTKVSEPIVGQTKGVLFEIAVSHFVESTFPLLSNIRPGKWVVRQLGNQSPMHSSDFAQYEHLQELDALARRYREIKSVLGNDYVVAPDVIVYRDLYTDDELNKQANIVDENSAKQADLRLFDSDGNERKPLLHASISAKWTMRSDRAQNSRTEALNLIRNRKGRLPHIVVVTAEPSPSRLASVALGTGDIDCVYHMALYELQDAMNEIAASNQDSAEQLEELVRGKRLKDISDLPLDLSV